MEIDRIGAGNYAIDNIGSNHLDAVFVDHNNNGQVWIDTYTKYHEDSDEYYSARPQSTTFGWVDADTAELIALAILDAVYEARKGKA